MTLGRRLLIPLCRLGKIFFGGRVFCKKRGESELGSWVARLSAREDSGGAKGSAKLAAARVLFVEEANLGVATLPLAVARDAATGDGAGKDLIAAVSLAELAAGAISAFAWFLLTVALWECLRNAGRKSRTL